MEPPKKVQVGPYSYTVEVSELAGARAKVSQQNAHTVGQSDHSAQRIDIEAEQGPDQLADTLLHEVLHCVWSTSGLYLGPAAKHEELIVGAASTLLLDTLRRNPELVSFLVATDG